MAVRERDPESTEAIGERIVETRLAMGYGGVGGQARFAARIGASPQKVNNWERGSKRISVDEARHLRRTLGLSMDWIYCGDMRLLDNDIATKINDIRRGAATLRRTA